MQCCSCSALLTSNCGLPKAHERSRGTNEDRAGTEGEEDVASDSEDEEPPLCSECMEVVMQKLNEEIGEAKLELDAYNAALELLEKREAEEQSTGDSSETHRNAVEQRKWSHGDDLDCEQRKNPASLEFDQRGGRRDGRQAKQRGLSREKGCGVHRDALNAEHYSQRSREPSSRSDDQIHDVPKPAELHSSTSCEGVSSAVHSSADVSEDLELKQTSSSTSAFSVSSTSGSPSSSSSGSFSTRAPLLAVTSLAAVPPSSFVEPCSSSASCCVSYSSSSSSQLFSPQLGSNQLGALPFCISKAGCISAAAAASASASCFASTSSSVGSWVVSSNPLSSCSAYCCCSRATWQSVGPATCAPSSSLGSSDGLCEKTARLEEQKKLLQRQIEHLTVVERQFWREFSLYQSELGTHEEHLAAVTSSIDYVASHLNRLKTINVLNDTFHISQSGPFGTINGLRLGRRLPFLVPWDEINAAWGQVCLLLEVIGKKCNIEFTGDYRLVPRGSYSVVVRRSDKIELELYGSEGGLTRFFSGRRFDMGMVGFLGCVNEVIAKLEERRKASAAVAAAAAAAKGSKQESSRDLRKSLDNHNSHREQLRASTNSNSGTDHSDPPSNVGRASVIAAGEAAATGGVGLSSRSTSSSVATSNTDDGRQLYIPFKIDGDKIEGFSIRLQFNQEERWTKALRFLLIDLKWLVRYVEEVTNQNSAGQPTAD